MSKDMITRFAPSPTGELHIGGIRTALFNFLFARQKAGKFYLRIEDTDQERLVAGATARIQEDLKDFGLTWDNKPVMIQSERKEIYQKAAKELIEKGHAYYCFCSKERLEEVRKNQETLKKPPMYDGCCCKLSKKEIEENLSSGKEHVVRLMVPETGKLKFNDLVRGEIEIDLSTIDDQVLLKSDGLPTYHLANVVDDHEMGVSHIIRADEWLPSTPKHILLYQYFGWEEPSFAHPPMILNPDHSKMSKRSGDVSARSFLEAGYLVEALINFLVLLGWNPKTEQEFFTLEELIKVFDLAGINKAGAVFDREKLDHFNNHYLRKYPPEELFDKLIGSPEDTDFEKFKSDKDFSIKALKIIQPRLKTIAFKEIWGETAFFFALADYDSNLLIFKKSDKDKTILGLTSVIEKLTENNEWQDTEVINKILAQVVVDKNLTNGDVFWPARVAVSGLESSPPPQEIMWVLGKEESLKRLQTALEKLK